jgi:hypothetical protein
LFDIITEIYNSRKKSDDKRSELIMAGIAMFIFKEGLRMPSIMIAIDVSSKGTMKRFLKCVYHLFHESNDVLRQLDS